MVQLQQPKDDSHNNFSEMMPYYAVSVTLFMAYGDSGLLERPQPDGAWSARDLAFLLALFFLACGESTVLIIEPQRGASAVPPCNCHFFHHPPTHRGLAVRRSTRARVELGLGSDFASLTQLGLGSDFASLTPLDYENAADAVLRGH